MAKADLLTALTTEQTRLVALARDTRMTANVENLLPVLDRLRTIDAFITAETARL